jgi:hypothetical protein
VSNVLAAVLAQATPVHAAGVQGSVVQWFRDVLLWLHVLYTATVNGASAAPRQLYMLQMCGLVVWLCVLYAMSVTSRNSLKGKAMCDHDGDDATGKGCMWSMYDLLRLL